MNSMEGYKYLLLIKLVICLGFIVCIHLLYVPVRPQSLSQINPNVDKTKSAKLKLVNEVPKLAKTKSKRLKSKTNLTTLTLATDRELARFERRLATWPDNKPKAAFIILTRGKAKNRQRLNSTLRSVDKYFNEQFAYPVIIFHEPDLVRWKPAILNMTTSDVYFQYVNLSAGMASWLDPDSFMKDSPCPGFRLGYRHMCHFFAKGVYDEPTVRLLDYYWRMDDNSVLTAPVPYDVFQFMRQHDLQYGYNRVVMDSAICVAHLWEITENYTRERALPLNISQKWPRRRVYFNNFEIASTAMWLSKEYQDYMRHLDNIGGIYLYRWGDAPIHSLAVNMFLRDNQTHNFTDIGYHHYWTIAGGNKWGLHGPFRAHDIHSHDPKPPPSTLVG